MSFDINWSKLTTDSNINGSIKEFLHDQLQGLSLPSYISNLEVVDFNLGDIPPEITIRHIGDPFEDFYCNREDGEDEDGDGDADGEGDTDGHGESHAHSTMNNTTIREEKDTDGSYEDDDDFEDEDDGEDKDDDEDADEEDEKEEILDDNEDQDQMSAVTEAMNSTDVSNGTPTPPLVSSPQRPPLRQSHLPPAHAPGGNKSFKSVLHPYGMSNMSGTGAGTGTGAVGGDTPDALFNNSRVSSRTLIPKIKTKDKDERPLVGENDVQLILEINYKGDLHIDLLVTLLVNYPSPNFIALPIKLHITDLVVHSVAALAYLRQSVYFSFLCDVNDEVDYMSASSNTTAVSTPTVGGANFVDYYFGSGDASTKERIDIIKKIKIESEIGEVENNILRNVGKVEKFLTDQLRYILREEIAWPSWISIDMNDDEEEEEEGEEEEEEEA
ncbi:uncharacterized protein LODBEIA_P57960 [Lodderomyces beijingensis]|uniref:Mitochondrial distribution and morphology protein 12 n=1 Tax=Lodderomyces beijingensis TaxID=1775926 RepID=A0ABP0ZVJ3_9ASCO